MTDGSFTTRELAEWLVVPVQTVYDWRCRGVGPRGEQGFDGIRYELADVLAWFEERAA